MSKKKSLSYTAYSKYMSCPYSYHLHYNEKLRPAYTSSDLFFGDCIDSGFNAILNKSEEPMVEYIKAGDKYPIGSVSYKQADYDGELIEPCFKAEVLTTLKQYGYTGTDIDFLAKYLFSKQASNEELSDNQKCALDAICRLSLEHKAAYFFTAYEEQVLPYINEIVAVQKRVGNGVIDAILNFKEHGICVVDHKTTKRAYQDDAVAYSVQLANYCRQVNIPKAMYITFGKVLKKNRVKLCKKCGKEGKRGTRATTCDHEIKGVRCRGEWEETIRPEVSVQLLIDDVDLKTMQDIQTSFEQVEALIEQKHFPKNLNACLYMYGSRCPYLNYCWKGKMNGLKRQK